MSFNIIPVASEYQEIHPYSVVNVSNIKISEGEERGDKPEQAELWGRMEE